jgi:predicted RNA-binding protein YlqC (UPF0109 family)
MKDCLVFIINSLLGEETTKITEEVIDNKIMLTIEPKQENFGRIIGKKGKIINAIRKLLRVRATKEGKKVFIEVGRTDQLANGSVLTEDVPVASGTSIKAS